MSLPQEVVLVKINDPECIICLDGGNLTNNSRCNCKYTYHAHCMNGLDKPDICIMCKVNVGITTPVQPERRIAFSPFMCMCVLCVMLIPVLITIIWIIMNP